MKNIVQTIICIATACILLVGCSENKWATFDSKNAYVAINESSYSIREDSPRVLNIPVGASNIPSAPLTVGFEITVDDTDGYRQAVEGVDYNLLNTSRELHFATGVGYDTIRIQPINNADKDGHSTFRIKLTSVNQSYAIGFVGEREYADVLIFDDESISKWEGEWRVDGKTAIYYQNGKRYETADTSNNNTAAIVADTVTIVSHPTLVNTFIIKNFMNTPTLEAQMTIDEAARTLTLKVGKIGVLKGRDIYMDSFSDEEQAPFSMPVEGNIINDDMFKVYRYAALMEIGGVYYLIHDNYFVLKSTWTRVN